MNELEQIQKLINDSQKIIIIPPKEICGDSLGSSIALSNCLRKNNPEKEIKIYLQVTVPKRLEFLIPQDKDIFIDSLESKAPRSIEQEKGVNKLSTLIESLGVNKKYSVQKFNQSHAKPKHSDKGVAISIGCKNLKSITEINDKNQEFFSKTPIINIDYHKDNEGFGNINFTSKKASSTSEITAKLIKFLEGTIDKECATCLLCGIIEKTNSFRRPETTPDTLYTASKLVDFGADQKTIVKHLYKTKQLDYVKLWGEITSNLKCDNHKKIVTSFLENKSDQQSTLTTSLITGLLMELKENFVQYNHFSILWKTNGAIYGVISTKNQELIKKIATKAQVKEETDYAIFKTPEKNIIRAESLIFNLINEPR